MTFFQELRLKHENLKKKIHSFRMPLSRNGQRFMGFVYFLIPVVSGYFIMDIAIKQSEENLKSLKSLKSIKNEKNEKNGR